MSQQANIVINDGQPTPVAHTFEPNGVSVSNGKTIAEWVDRSASTLIGQYLIQKTQSPPDGVGRHKVVYTISLPTLETLGSVIAGYEPPAKVAYRNVGKIEFWLNERSSLQERDDTYQLVKNLLGNATVESEVINLAKTW